MTTNVVTDEELGILARRQHDLFRRVRDGSLPIGQVLGGLQNLIEGKFGASSRRVIDCDADPYVPDDWGVVSHTKGGDKFEFDLAKVALYLSKKQESGTIKGHALRKELEEGKKLVLNACVLDHLLKNPSQIPESWKGKALFFWGTIYRNSFGNVYVRCLCWSGTGWCWDCNDLGAGWNAYNPAVLLAS